MPGCTSMIGLARQTVCILVMRPSLSVVRRAGSYIMTLVRQAVRIAVMRPSLS